MKTISLINLKGGVGKTTIATNLAYLLAESWELRVLFIDNDKQGNASRWFSADEAKGTLSNILMDGAKASDVIQIRDVKKFHPTLSIRGILVNQYISYPGFSSVREDVSDVGIPLFQTKISYATRNAKHGLMTASREGKSIFEVCPNCRVARDIMHFAEELLGGE